MNQTKDNQVVGLGEHAATAKTTVATLAHGEEIFVAIQIRANLVERFGIPQAQSVTDRQILSGTTKHTGAITLEDPNLLAWLDAPTDCSHRPRLLSRLVLWRVVNVGSAATAANNVLTVLVADKPVEASTFRTRALRLVRLPSDRLESSVLVEVGGCSREVSVVSSNVPQRLFDQSIYVRPALQVGRLNVVYAHTTILALAPLPRHGDKIQSGPVVEHVVEVNSREHAVAPSRTELVKLRASHTTAVAPLPAVQQPGRS